MSLTVYENDTPLFPENSENEKRKAMKLLNDIQSSNEFFAMRIQKRLATYRDSYTHMGLMESYIKELAPYVHYDSILDEQMKRRYKEIREVNQENRRLKEQMGKTISAIEVSAYIRRMSNVLHAWGDLWGFDFLIDRQTYAHGFAVETDQEILNEPRNIKESKKENPVYEILRPYRHHISDDPNHSWDLLRLDYHNELLDTDRNRQNLTDILKTDFPNAEIRGFKSRINDKHSFSLSASVIISFEDLENFEKSIVTTDAAGRKLKVGDAVISHTDKTNGFHHLVGTITEITPASANKRRTVDHNTEIFVNFTNDYGPEKAKKLHDELKEVAAATCTDINGWTLDDIYMKPSEVLKINWSALSDTEKNRYLNEDEIYEETWKKTAKERKLICEA